MGKVSDQQVSRDGRLIEAGHRVCKMADKGDKTGEECKELHEKVVMNKMETRQYLDALGELCNKDEKAKSVIGSLINLITGR